MAKKVDDNTGASLSGDRVHDFPAYPEKRNLVEPNLQSANLRAGAEFDTGSCREIRRIRIVGSDVNFLLASRRRCDWRLRRRRHGYNVFAWRQVSDRERAICIRFSPTERDHGYHRLIL
jgi:hypothetical protein